MSYVPTGQERGGFRRSELGATVRVKFVRYAEGGEVCDQGPCEALGAGQRGDDVWPTAETVDDNQIPHARLLCTTQK